MPITNINIVKTISIGLPENQSNIVTIYQNEDLVVGQDLIEGYKIISFNSFIKNLKVFARIRSVVEAPMPDFKEEDSDTDKTYKTLDVEWKSPRKQLTLWISNNSQEWFKVGSISLLNPVGYPYRIYNLMDLYTDNLAIELGENGRLGINVDNVGHGLIQSTDTVTIHGSSLKEVFVQSADIVPVTNVYVSGAVTDNNNPVVSSTINNSFLINNDFTLRN